MVALFTPGWIQEVLDVPLAEIAEAVGLGRRSSGSWSPCLACGAERRGKSDPRGPIGFRPDERGWRCHPCGLTGNGVTLVALRVAGEPRPRGAAWSQIRAWCEERGWARVVAEGGRAGGPSGREGSDPRARELPQRRPRPAASPLPKRLPPDEVQSLWSRCAPVLDDAEVCGWLRSRALDPATIEDLDLARALVEGRPRILPRWARFRGRPWWRTGHRLLVPMFDAEGRMASLQARSILPGPAPGEKAANPTGAQVAGLVLADGLGQQLLRGAWTEPTDVVISEGVPDFLTWAARWGADAGLEGMPAVLGVVSGSWRREEGAALAARIPRASRVVIRTHADEAGEAYAAEIARTLLGRCRVLRGGIR